MIAERVGDPRFFAHTGPHAIDVVAQAAGADAPVCSVLFDGVAPLQTAGPSDISFLDNRRYADLLADTRAGAVILHPALLHRVPEASVALATRTPYLGWAAVCALFYPPEPRTPAIHPTAVIDSSAIIHPGTAIAAFAVIGAGADIGGECSIGSHAVIGPGVIMGPHCSIGSHVTVTHAILGARVRLFPGVRIGQDGFGFATDATGRHVSVPQLGRVILHDDVEVGANTTIDRGSMRDTVIGAGSRLDNLVQIGHNVRLGQGCVIVAQVGISGSTILEDHVMVAGQAGLTGHLHIGSNARIGAQSGVMADIPDDTSVMGSPSQPARQYFRELATLRRQARRGQAQPD